MAITTLAQLRAAPTQRIATNKIVAGSTNPQPNWWTWSGLNGDHVPALDPGNTSTGVVPTADGTQYPALDAFAGLSGYISRVEVTSGVAGNHLLFDRLFVAGAFAYNTSPVTLTSQPSFASRVPDSDYSGLEIWVEMASTANNLIAVEVEYVNESGVAGRTTGSYAAPNGGAMQLRRCWPLPLQAGDHGVQRIDKITATPTATSGTFNVMVLRRLCSARVWFPGHSNALDFMRTGLPMIYETSALFPLMVPDTTSSGLLSMRVDVVKG